MNDQKIILSISLLCSGRKETTERCLESLRGLRERVNSELIIVDTGCDEDTKKIVSDYADRIIPFTWCDDFSAARNVGMEKAHGEWFMYLDDDEWFMDTEEIEQFFLSGEYMEYNYACYTVRNYRSMDKKFYADSWAPRMVSLKERPKFLGSIHECFYPLYEPCRLLHSKAEHFGYIFSNEEEKQAHAERNISLLQGMIEKQKMEIRWWIHLIQEYKAIEEYEKLEELCQDGIRVFKKENSAYINRYRGVFYCGLADTQVLRGDYEKAEKSIQEAFADRRNTDLCRMFLYTSAAATYYGQTEYGEALGYAEKYVENYARLKSDETTEYEQGGVYISEALEPTKASNVYCICMLCALHLGDTSVLKKYFYQLNWGGNLLIYKDFVEETVSMLTELPYDDEMCPLVKTMAKQEGLDAFWNVLEKIKVESEKSEKGKKKFLQLQDYMEKIFSCADDVFQLNFHAFEAAEKYHINMSKIIERISFNDWRAGTDYFFNNADYETIAERVQTIVHTKPAEEKMTEKMSIRYEYFLVKAAEADVVHRREREEFYDLEKRFLYFTYTTLDFYRKYYKKNAFRGEMEIFPACYRLAVKWEKLIQAQIAGEQEKVRAYLREAEGIVPAFDEMIRLYGGLYAYSEKIKSDNEVKEMREAKEEMQTLAAQIKVQIDVLLSQGMKNEALQAVRQLKTFMPEDKELSELELRLGEK